MPDSSTPVLILGSKKNSLSVTRYLLLRISEPMPPVATALAVLHHVTVK